MPDAGETAVTGLWPGQRLATSIATSVSANFTGTEGTVMSVMFSQTTGQRYRVRFAGGFNATTSLDQIRVRLRENTGAGTVRVDDAVEIRIATSRAWPITFEIPYIASATGSKTFVVTGQVINTAGPGWLHANPNDPSYLYVDYLGTA